MPSRNPAGQLLSKRLTEMLEALPGAGTGDPDAVHRARVASRRLREALPVLGARADEAVLRKARKQVRRVTRALGPVRELDVALGHLEDAAGKGAPAAAVVAVRRVLARERRSRRTEMLPVITPRRIAKLERRVSGVAPPTAAPAARQQAIRQEATRRVKRRARVLAAAIRDAGSLYHSGPLHAVRVAAKKLRYAVEIRQELDRSRASGALKTLKRLQDLLGRLHDIEMLIEKIRTSTTDAAGAALEPTVQALEEECRALHAGYMAERPGLLDLTRALQARGTTRRGVSASRRRPSRAKAA